LLLLLYLQHIYSLNIFTRLCISVLLCSVLEVSLCSGGLHVFGTYFLSSDLIPSLSSTCLALSSL
jgi:hypothetical protein